MTHSSLNHNSTIRERLSVRGRVQGVGFRPFVYRLAVQIGLNGQVGNDSHGAFIEIQGRAEQIEAFKRRLATELPPLAQIAEATTYAIPCRDEPGFHIKTSDDDGTQDAEITPDIALCADCRREMFDPTNRRYHYPFINCTNCGPRYSIIRAIPYDRPGTTMAKFRMCPACQAEYDDPANRRFHAQPNACPICGPSVWLEMNNPQSLGRTDTKVCEGAISRCARLLLDGKIVAIKGLGGFHLACRADDDEVVALLRSRKSRESKPLAVMVADMNTARTLAELDEVATQALTNVTRPIVLVPKRSGTRVSQHVAPGTDTLGLLLPYTPLHELLFAEGLGPMVMTSGNPTEEPLCCENEEALTRLAHIADAFLLHDREIERRVDDSVVLATSASPENQPIEQKDSLIPIRRARGFAPAPIRVPVSTKKPVLAVGAELKSTICVLAGQTAIVSEHLGELANAKAYRNFTTTVEQFQRLLRTQPQIVAYDLHPEYSSSRFAQSYAKDRGLMAIGIQHHHAHIVSAMAENGLTGRVLGIACDGTGFGTDGAVWGCELLVTDGCDSTRAGHLRYFPLLGGDAAARDTWRPAAALLYDTFGKDWQYYAGTILAQVPRESLDMAQARLTNRSRLPLTSSLGRLFDAVAFLLGVADTNHHEAQAAMALEAAARRATGYPELTFNIQNPEDSDSEPLLLDVRPMIRELLTRRQANEDPALMARSFHVTLAAALAEAASRIALRCNVKRVVLSGGCFANRLLRTLLSEQLSSAGMEVYSHRMVPTGDGGISLGQAICAAVRVAGLEMET